MTSFVGRLSMAQGSHGHTAADAAAALDVTLERLARWNANELPEETHFETLGQYMGLTRGQVRELVDQQRAEPVHSEPAGALVANPLGAVLRERRIELGDNQRDVARILNRSPSMIARWEGGTRRPSERDLAGLASYLEIEATELLDVLHGETDNLRVKALEARVADLERRLTSRPTANNRTPAEGAYPPAERASALARAWATHAARDSATTTAHGSGQHSSGRTAGNPCISDRSQHQERSVFGASGAVRIRRCAAHRHRPPSPTTRRRAPRRCPRLHPR
jgi:transcriptional regulator with XRE-family HTH domain